MLVAAIVVTYNPYTVDLFCNVLTYSRNVNYVIIVDNSTIEQVKNDIMYWSSTHGFIYEDMEGNKGIAVALNRGIELAIIHNCSWVLTMDQDSFFQSGIDGFWDYIGRNNESNNIIFIAPTYCVSNSKCMLKTTGIQRSKFIWQSGNLVNVSNYLKLGPYMERLFIDYVDYEYCLRARMHKYDYFQIPSVVLNHNPGNVMVGHLGGFKYKYHDSALVRYYYFIRNGLYVSFLYKDLDCLTQLLKIVIKVLCVEQNKKNKCLYMRRGLIDLMNKRFYKLSE